MSIGDRTNPRRRIPRKLGTNPTNTGAGLDGGGSFAGRQNWTPPTGTQPFPTPTPLPAPAPAPAPGTFPTPTPLPIQAGRPNPLPLVPNLPNAGIPGGPGSGQTPVPQPGTPLPLYPEPAPAPGGQLPGGLGMDFMRNVTPNELVANQLQALLQSDSPYMRNAEQRGLEHAASRGNLNSSIAAGSARRAALEAATPIAQADADVYRQANSENFQSLNQLRQMRTAAQLEDWLGSTSYNREWNGQMAQSAIRNSMDMWTYITQRAMEDPAVWTPDVMSGFNNFFNQQMFDSMSMYFGSSYAPGGT